MKMKLSFNKFVLTIPLVYLITRLINLSIIPIFTDEAIYSYWAQVALNDPANRYISLEDGKQPLFIWLAAAMQKFVSDPLIASRLVSVFAGLGSIVGIYFLTKTIFTNVSEPLRERIARLATILYLVLPFTFVYDRIALFDSLLTMLGIYAVLFTVKMIQNPRLDYALINGIILGLGLITKSSANFFLYLLPISVILFDFKKQNTKKLATWGILTALSAFIALVIYNALRLSALFYMIDRKNHEFIRSAGEVISDPFLHFVSNGKTIVIWLRQYLGIPFLLATIGGIIWGVVKKQKEIIFLCGYITMPLLVEVLFNKVLYPRFILFYFPYIIIITSFALVHLFERVKKYHKFAPAAILASILLIPAITTFRLATDPPKAKIADSDSGQYINNWPAGYGVKETVAILKEEAKDKRVVVGTEGTFGLLPYALKIYFYGNPNIEITGYWPVSQLPQQIKDAAKVNKTFFVFNENQKERNPEDLKHLKLIGKYQKGDNADSFMRLYEVVN